MGPAGRRYVMEDNGAQPGQVPTFGEALTGLFDGLSVGPAADWLSPTTLAVLDGFVILFAASATVVGWIACRRLRRLQQGREEWLTAMREFSERADGAEVALRNLTIAIGAEAERRRTPPPPPLVCAPPPARREEALPAPTANSQKSVSTSILSMQ